MFGQLSVYENLERGGITVGMKPTHERSPEACGASSFEKIMKDEDDVVRCELGIAETAVRFVTGAIVDLMDRHAEEDEVAQDILRLIPGRERIELTTKVGGTHPLRGVYTVWAELPEAGRYGVTIRPRHWWHGRYTTIITAASTTELLAKMARHFSLELRS